MIMSATDIVLIIGALGLAAVNVITALKVKEIAHSVNSTATAAQNEIQGLRKEVVALTATIADRKQVAAVLAQSIAKDN